MSSVSGASSSGASSLAVDQPEETWQDWEEDESEGFKSLFGDARFPSLDGVLAHDAEAHGFNLRQYRAQLGLDQLGTIRLINYVRTAAAAGEDPLPALAAAAGGGAAPWEDDRYLQPALMDDELMLHDWEEEDETEAGTGGGSALGAAAATAAGSSGAAVGAAPELAALRRENQALRGMVEALRSAVLQHDEGMRELVAEAQGGGSSAGASTSAAASAPQQQGQQQQAAEQPRDEAAKRIDDSYFDSYSTFDIHREMLADKARTEAYRDALEKNPSLLRGARVLDVGCGTGILSMFAARGGAAAVVGIDGSAAIAKFARANVEANGLAASAGGPVTIVSSKVEELAALPLPAGAAGTAGTASKQQFGDQQQSGAQQAQQQAQQAQQQVDVLVSEWMGYALLFESMLDSVLHARDRWLRPGGAVLPDIARIYLAAASEAASGLDFWRDVYGFSMGAVRDSLWDDALKRAVVRVVSPQHLLSEPLCLQSFDLATMKPSDQDFTAPFRLTVGAGPQRCGALVLWFDTLFSDRFCKDHPVELSTSPYGPQTHWVQTVLLLKQPVEMVPPAAAAAAPPGAAVALAGQLSMTRSRQTHRSLDIVLRYAPQYADGTAGEEQVCIYGMGVEA
ncbi:hypothetical protein ABPG75_012879 [Micractinium tetrahymenae]